jgi:hypothetical protein
MSTRAIPGGPSDLLDQVAERLSQGTRELRAYLASQEGRELRRRVAQLAIIAAPLLFRMRFFRASSVGRAIGLIGGAALVVKAAEALRDWEPLVETPTEA